MIVTNDLEHDVAVDRMIQLERQPNPVENAELNSLAEAVDAHEDTAGYTPDPPRASGSVNVQAAHSGA